MGNDVGVFILLQRWIMLRANLNDRSLSGKVRVTLQRQGIQLAKAPLGLWTRPVASHRCTAPGACQAHVTAHRPGTLERHVTIIM